MIHALLLFRFFSFSLLLLFSSQKKEHQSRKWYPITGFFIPITNNIQQLTTYILLRPAPAITIAYKIAVFYNRRLLPLQLTWTNTHLLANKQGVLENLSVKIAVPPEGTNAQLHHER